jgi:putative ABC transport system substrate-binding protein
MRRREFIAGLAGAAAWAPTSLAQQPAVPMIGILNGQSEAGNPQAFAVFRESLGNQGYIEGRNVEILYRWAETRYDRLPVLAADLVRRRVALIVAGGGAAALAAAKAATATIPIVFIAGADPVELGFVTSLNRPGGNATGVTFLTVELLAKRLELLREIIPAAATIGFLVNPTTGDGKAAIREMESAARTLGVRLVVAKSSTASEIEVAFATLAGQHAKALAVASDPLFFNQANQLTALAARNAMPAIYHAREIVDAGGLMSYGASISDAYRLAGIDAGRILKGEKPADLPVQRSTRIEMVLNLKTAKALGLEVPTSVLLRADEVIE